MANKTSVLALTISVALLLVTAACSGCNTAANQSPTPTHIQDTGSPPDLASISLTQVLGNGKPTLAEFGSSTCIPCKEMKPILEELAKEYKEKLNVVIVEVYDHMDLTRQYQIMTIPTQIFFDSNGKEIARHIGFWAKEEIIAQLKKMGID
ncbi:thioredoxin family protein [Chloroflexota bacterium]